MIRLLTWAAVSTVAFPLAAIMALAAFSAFGELFRADPRVDLGRVLHKPEMFLLAASYTIIPLACKLNLPAIIVLGVVSHFRPKLIGSRIIAAGAVATAFAAIYATHRVVVGPIFDEPAWEFFWMSLIFVSLLGPCIVNRPRVVFSSRTAV